MTEFRCWRHLLRMVVTKMVKTVHNIFDSLTHFVSNIVVNIRFSILVIYLIDSVTNLFKQCKKIPNFSLTFVTEILIIETTFIWMVDVDDEKCWSRFCHDDQNCVIKNSETGAHFESPTSACHQHRLTESLMHIYKNYFRLTKERI